MQFRTGGELQPYWLIWRRAVFRLRSWCWAVGCWWLWLPCGDFAGSCAMRRSGTGRVVSRLADAVGGWTLGRGAMMVAPRYVQCA